MPQLQVEDGNVVDPDTVQDNYDDEEEVVDNDDNYVDAAKVTRKCSAGGSANSQHEKSDFCLFTDTVTSINPGCIATNFIISSIQIETSSNAFESSLTNNDHHRHSSFISSSQSRGQLVMTIPSSCSYASFFPCRPCPHPCFEGGHPRPCMAIKPFPVSWLTTK